MSLSATAIGLSSSMHIGDRGHQGSLSTARSFVQSEACFANKQSVRPRPKPRRWYVSAKLDESELLPGQKLVLAWTRAVNLTRSCFRQPLRGWANTDLLEIRESTHGRGVFATRDIPEGETLGEYPGVRKSVVVYSGKSKTLKGDGRLNESLMRCQDMWYLDPTDEAGELPEDGILRWGPLSANATLAYINEPEDVLANCSEEECSNNVVIEEQEPGCIEFITTAPVRAGEELLVFYGDHYDRTHYTA